MFTILQTETGDGYKFRVAERDAYRAYCEEQSIPFATLSIDYDVAGDFRRLVAPVTDGVKMALFPNQDGLEITFKPVETEPEGRFFEVDMSPPGSRRRS